VTYEDHFSGVASEYGRFRPRYPESLFRYLATLAGKGARVWEVGAGSGQATAGLLRTFDHVIATDASFAQLAQIVVPTARRLVCLAEVAPFRAASMDLIVAAQALHWLEPDGFFREVARVARRGAALTAWTYGLPEIDQRLDALLRRFAHEDIRDFWPSARDHVEARYATIKVPFEEMAAPDFRIDARLDVDAFLGYVRTWSAVTRAGAALDVDPMARFGAECRALWGPASLRGVSWPVTLRTFRVREG